MNKNETIWGNLPSTLSQKVGKWWTIYFVMIVFLLPILTSFEIKITSHIVMIGLFAVHLPIGWKLIALLRSGKQLLKIGNDQANIIYRIYYKISMGLGGFAMTVLLTYFVMIVLLYVLSFSLGITNEQELPDYSSSTYTKLVYASIFAGVTEEVWRWATIGIIMMAAREFMPSWRHKKVQWSVLTLAVLVSSFVFGWLHSFGYSDTSFSVPITIQIGSVGVILSLISILTRRIWLAIAFHAFHDYFVFSFNKISGGVTSSMTEQQMLAALEPHSLYFAISGSFIVFGFLFGVSMLFTIRKSKLMTEVNKDKRKAA